MAPTVLITVAEKVGASLPVVINNIENNNDKTMIPMAGGSLINRTFT
jgi:hypothetical protein